MASIEAAARQKIFLGQDVGCDEFATVAVKPTPVRLDDDRAGVRYPEIRSTGEPIQVSARLVPESIEVARNGFLDCRIYMPAGYYWQLRRLVK